VIWAKNTFTLGRSDYQRQYEPILYGWKQGADHYWCGDRDQGDVWFFDKPAKNDLHPTMKPVALVERAIRNSSKSRDIVLDPFGGSGTTLIAAERTGRRARLIEQWSSAGRRRRAPPRVMRKRVSRFVRHRKSRTPPTARSAENARPIATKPKRLKRRVSSATSAR